MSSKPDTWMPLYIGDYLADTIHLTAEQHGAYLLLIMACWKAGGLLPEEDALLASCAKLTPTKWRAYRPIISKFFAVTPTGWRHKRIDVELEKARGLSERGRRGGQASAAQRADKEPTKSQQGLN